MSYRRRLSAGFVSALALAMALAGTIGPAAPAGAVHETIDWSNWRGVPTVAADQFYPSVLADQRGSMYIFFFDRNPANGFTNISVAKFATRGPTGNPQHLFTRLVNPTLPNNVVPSNWYGQAWPPSAAIDHNGNLYVAWADTSFNVYVSKSVDGGNSWGAPSRVDPTVPQSFDSGPLIAAAPSGTLYVVWFQLWAPGPGYHNLTVARSTDAGVTWTGKANVTAYGTAAYISHSLAVDSSNRLHVTYASFMSFPNWRSNYTWSDGGATWSPPYRLDAGPWSLFPVAAADASGRVHTLWYDGRQSSNGVNTYWYRRSDDRGATWTMEMPVSQGRYLTGLATYPTLAIHGETVIAGWGAYSGPLDSLGYSVSADGGDLWYPERLAEFETDAFLPRLAADENGTFYAAFYRFGATADPAFAIWDGPPSTPAITNIARGPDYLDVSWTVPPEGDLAGYRVWRSTDGVAYELVATLAPSYPVPTYRDAGLSNGTYWYRVTAFDARGTSSHASNPMSAAVGQSTEERIADLEAQIAALQAALDSGQADLQAQIDALQADLDDLQSSTDTQYDALQDRIDDLQGQLNSIQAEKATQTQSYLNTLLIIIVIVMLVFMLMQSRRMSAMRSQMPVPPPASPPWQSPPQNPPPDRPMSPPRAPPEPKLPDDEL